jgi:hypothetical protein
MQQHPVTLSLNFMPAFFHKHTGVVYGEAYYFDPRYRAAVERIEGRFLNDILGRFGVGSPDPTPSPSLFIQPIDLVKATQGATVYCPADATLETRGHPWAALTVEEIARLDPHAAAAHPFIDAILRQYQELVHLYGDRADLFGLKGGRLNIHAPYTTAHQLCGEAVFYLLADDPAGARLVFETILAIYLAIVARLRAELQAPEPTWVQLGDCSASLLSEPVYREAVLPVNQAIAAAYPRAGYHSCGSSSHLLAAFAELPHVQALELGPGTDLAQAVALLPGVTMCPLIDPVLMRDGSPAMVRDYLGAMLAATAPAPATTLCAWSLDRDTPIANVEALYQAVAASHGGGRTAD